MGLKRRQFEVFVVNSLQLKRLEVEESKLCDVARNLASIKFIDGFI